MLLSQFTAVLTAIPLLAAGTPGIEIAQNSDSYADWIYLYEDSFEDNAGQTITQQLWLDPDSIQAGSLHNFTLLARRSPASSNGTAAAVYDYVADCETRSYAIERIEYLDSSDGTLDVQTSQRVMESANPDSPFKTVLDNICTGAY